MTFTERTREREREIERAGEGGKEGGERPIMEGGSQRKGEGLKGGKVKMTHDMRSRSSFVCLFVCVFTYLSEILVFCPHFYFIFLLPLLSTFISGEHFFPSFQNVP